MITPSPKKLTVSSVVYCCHVNAYIITSATPIIGHISYLDSFSNDFNDILSAALLTQFPPKNQKIFSQISVRSSKTPRALCVYSEGISYIMQVFLVFSFYGKAAQNI